MASLQKNTASQFFTFVTVSSTGGGPTTSTSTAQFNSAAFLSTGTVQSALAGTFTSLGNGQWAYGPTQSETNYTAVGYLFVPSATVPTNIHFFTDLTDAGGNIQVDTVKFGGTSVTGRDLGASVLLSSGTGTGQLNIISGVAQVTVTTNSDKTGYTLTATAQSSMADVLLDRDMSLGVDSGSSSVRTPRQAMRVLRNKVDTSSGTTLVVYKEDDATTSWTASITVSSSAQPIVTLTPP